jgi:hypothetical protein
MGIEKKTTPDAMSGICFRPEADLRASPVYPRYLDRIEMLVQWVDRIRCTYESIMEKTRLGGETG